MGDPGGRWRDRRARCCNHMGCAAPLPYSRHSGYAESVTITIIVGGVDWPSAHWTPASSHNVRRTGTSPKPPTERQLPTDVHPDSRLGVDRSLRDPVVRQVLLAATSALDGTRDQSSL